MLIFEATRANDNRNDNNRWNSNIQCRHNHSTLVSILALLDSFLHSQQQTTSVSSHRAPLRVQVIQYCTQALHSSTSLKHCTQASSSNTAQQALLSSTFIKHSHFAPSIPNDNTLSSSEHNQATHLYASKSSKLTLPLRARPTIINHYPLYHSATTTTLSANHKLITTSTSYYHLYNLPTQQHKHHPTKPWPTTVSFCGRKTTSACPSYSNISLSWQSSTAQKFPFMRSLLSSPTLRESHLLTPSLSGL
jgi:hypothetical protein